LLEEIGTPFYKVASFELTDLPLIKYIASKNKPVILSTGMANEVEIDEAVEIVKKYGCGDFVLLHCVSGYPTPIDQINLDTINLLRQKFRTEIGLSDHTLGNVSAIMSIAYGVKIIEKHFTLKRDDGGPDAGFSMEPEELLTLSRDVRDAHDAIGEGSFARKDAEKSNAKFRRSLYIVEDIKKGEIFTKKNLRKIRPGYGLPPKLFDEIIGKKTNQDIKRGTALSLDMVD
jgi:N-acetylneuraminate synthase